MSSPSCPSHPSAGGALGVLGVLAVHTSVLSPRGWGRHSCLPVLPPAMPRWGRHSCLPVLSPHPPFPIPQSEIPNPRAGAGRLLGVLGVLAVPSRSARAGARAQCQRTAPPRRAATTPPAPAFDIHLVKERPASCAQTAVIWEPQQNQSRRGSQYTQRAGCPSGRRNAAGPCFACPPLPSCQVAVLLATWSRQVRNGEAHSWLLHTRAVIQGLSGAFRPVLSPWPTQMSGRTQSDSKPWWGRHSCLPPPSGAP